MDNTSRKGELLSQENIFLIIPIVVISLIIISFFYCLTRTKYTVVNMIITPNKSFYQSSTNIIPISFILSTDIPTTDKKPSWANTIILKGNKSFYGYEEQLTSTMSINEVINKIHSLKFYNHISEVNISFKISSTVSCNCEKFYSTPTNIPNLQYRYYVSYNKILNPINVSMLCFFRKGERILVINPPYKVKQKRKSITEIHTMSFRSINEMETELHKLNENYPIYIKFHETPTISFTTTITYIQCEK